jgi:hypothetical protein
VRVHDWRSSMKTDPYKEGGSRMVERQMYAASRDETEGHDGSRSKVASSSSWSSPPLGRNSYSVSGSAYHFLYYG